MDCLGADPRPQNRRRNHEAGKHERDGDRLAVFPKRADLDTGAGESGPLACTTLGISPLRLVAKTSRPAILATCRRPHPLRNMKKKPFLNPGFARRFRVNP